MNTLFDGCQICLYSKNHMESSHFNKQSRSVMNTFFDRCQICVYSVRYELFRFFVVCNQCHCGLGKQGYGVVDKVPLLNIQVRHYRIHCGP